MNDNYSEEELIEIYNNIPQILKPRIKVVKIAEDFFTASNSPAKNLRKVDKAICAADLLRSTPVAILLILNSK